LTELLTRYTLRASH